jgi:hypothetical protein
MNSLSRFHHRQLPRCVLPTTATHYLTNCTRARCSLGSVRSRPFDQIRSQEDRCVSRRLRSLQRGNRFVRSRSIRSRRLMSLRLSCFVTRLCASVPSFRMAIEVDAKVDPFRFCHPLRSESFDEGASAERRVEIDLPNAPVKEAQAQQSETRFPRCEARAFEPFSSRRFCTPITRKNVCRFARRSFQVVFFRRAQPKSLTRFELEIFRLDLPRRAESPPA